MLRLLLFLLICVIFLLPFTALSQDIQVLDKKKGFKEIVIGDSIQNYRSSFKFIEKAPDGYEVYGIREENPAAVKKYAQLGYIPIQQLNLLVYKNVIHEIRIFFAIEAFEDLKTILMKGYGEPNETPCEISESEAGTRSDCKWRGAIIALWCSAINVPEKQKVVVGFRNFEMVKKMRKELTSAAVNDL